ncbi:MAG: MFS transporter [Alphaproteobacteria bacterium]|nr:MFS transporter [Alphaproteobacteria bacterium]
MHDQEALPQARANTYVIILAILIGLSMMDRQLLAVVAEPIKHEFNLSDTDLGLLTGTLFAVIFSVASIPVSWAADRISRTGILTVCATFWALCTGVVGLSTAYVHLAAARVGLAVGEAGCNPCAQSLIADYVPPERRGRALAIYVMGGPAGLIAAGTLGGILNDQFGWRVAFYVLGGVSLFAAFIAAIMLPEPKRQREAMPVTIHAAAIAVPRGGYAALTAKPAFRYFILGTAFVSIAIYGSLVWGTTYVVRFFGWTPGEAGAVVGTLGAVVSLGGTWLGGRMSDSLSTRNARWLLLLPALGLLLASPCTLAAAFAPTIVVLFAASSGEAFFRTLTLAPAAAALQRLAPNDARARAAATAGVVGTLIGLGVGPVLVGAISDGLAPQTGKDSLRYGLAAMVIPQLLAAYCYWRASQTLREDLEE